MVKNKKATKLKIIIKNEGNSINIPGIPFWLINILADLGFGLSSIALKFADDLDEKTKRILDSIKSEDIKLIINELRDYGSFDLVDIVVGNETEVKISIL